MPSQVTMVPDSIKQPASSKTVALPVVVVPSVYVPLEFAVHVPFTWSEPEIDATLQVRGSRPTSEVSSAPLSDTHDDVTFQVPTTLPPHGVPFGHNGAPVPAVPPPLVPAAPVRLPPLGLHAAAATAARASALLRTLDRTFVEQSFSKGVLLRPFFQVSPFVGARITLLTNRKRPQALHFA
jgi:hypothetical protein